MIHPDVLESVLASGSAPMYDFSSEVSTQWQELGLLFLYLHVTDKQQFGYYAIPNKRLALEINERNGQNQIITITDEYNLSQWDAAEDMVNRTYDRTAERLHELIIRGKGVRAGRERLWSLGLRRH